jgi:hypothetical protein
MKHGHNDEDEDVLTDLLFFVLGVAFGALGFLFHRRAATRLNLRIKGADMSINVGQTATATISPTAQGVPGALVTGVTYDVQPAGMYSIAPLPDGSAATYTALVAGTGITATVSATNTAGTVLTDSAALPDVVAVVGPADALNLAVTTP